MRYATLPLTCLFMFTCLAQAQPADHPAEVELLADVATIQPGKPFNVGLRFRMQPHWHVYWINPGDSGEAPQAKWSLPDGFTVSELQFPVPSRFDQPGEIVGYGYEDEVLLIATITPPATLSSGQKVPIKVDVTWLVCADVCIPGEAKLSITLPAAADSAKPANEQLFATWQARLPVQADAAGVQISTRKDVAEQRLTIAVNFKDQAARNIAWFPPPADDVTFRDVQIQTKQKQTRITLKYAPLAGRALPQETMESVLAYDAVDGTRRGLVVPIDLQPKRDDVLLPSD